MDTDRFLTFYQSISGIVRDIKRREMSYMRGCGLRSVHLRCLIRIRASEGGLGAVEISRDCEMDKALTSRTLRELCNGGFLESRPRGRGAYKRIFLLTEKSERIMADFDRDISECIAAARNGIDAGELEIFYRVLFALGRNISEIAQENSEVAHDTADSDTIIEIK